MLKKITGKLINKIFRPEHTWQQIEYFSEKWKKRIQIMSSFIEENEQSVMDLGCGEMWLKEYIGEREYIGVDYKKRDEDTIVCDFNTGDFPDKKTDVIFISGCLEYIIDYESFIRQVTRRTEKVIISYCVLEENSSIKVRRNIGWKNDLTKLDIVKLFNRENFYLEAYSYDIPRNNIFVFKKR